MMVPAADSGLPHLLTLRDLMTSLNVSRQTAERLIAAGRIRPVRIGRVRRFRPEDLLAFIENARAPHVTPAQN